MGKGRGMESGKEETRTEVRLNVWATGWGERRKRERMAESSQRPPLTEENALDASLLVLLATTARARGRLCSDPSLSPPLVDQVPPRNARCSAGPLH